LPDWSTPFDTTLVIEARANAASTSAVVVLYGAAGLSLAWLPIGWALAAAVLLSAGAGHDWVRARRPLTLRWHGDGGWRVDGTTGGDGLTLDASTFVSRWLVILVLVDGRGRRRRYWLTAASVETPTWRRLKARLRVQGGACATGSRVWRVGED
jgi:hypothetical protein